MKAIVVDDKALQWRDVPDPTPGVGEVLIRNRATAINRADLAQRAGAYPPPPGAGPILGLECAGEVVAVGEGVARYRVGDKVCALLAGGGYAQLVNVAAGQVLRIPQGLSFEQAAALPEVFATAYLNLFMEARLAVGESVLLHAGASGVGTAAIQLCAMNHSPCFVTAGSDDKIARCVALGAAGGANRRTEAFAEAFADKVAAWTDGRGFDVILDPVGAQYLKANLRSLRVDGRLVVIGLMGGANTELELGLMMMKRLRIIGSTLRARSIAAKAGIMDELLRVVWPLLDAGTITPIIDTVVPITEAARAHEIVAADQTFGKVVMSIA
jgi:putative PIG3 family NAD(P)H quinone oxidoreductase